MAIKTFPKTTTESIQNITKLLRKRAEYEVKCKDCINRANTNGIDFLEYEDVQDIIRLYSKRTDY